MSELPPVEVFSPEEAARLRPYVTNLDRPVFALRNLPEVVKGALFARYSRTAKTLRRLLLDEFLDSAGGVQDPSAGQARAEALYDKVFLEFGDDSVAQLGGVHLACEGVSNLLSKALEWGRLASYLEQSTRYVPYTDKPGGRYKYHIPEGLGPLAPRYRALMEQAFDRYAAWLPRMEAYFEALHPPEGEADRAYRAAIRAKALDSVRGMLPAATRSNLGIYASGQAYENLLLRLFAAPEPEFQAFGRLILSELREVIPAFMTRVDLPARGGATTAYLKERRSEMQALSQELGLTAAEPSEGAVRLLDFDPDGELKVVAAALFSVSGASEATLLKRARAMSAAERARVLEAYVGRRDNRRHRPGRALERTDYRFEIVGDYGAFRDLQRHRLLSLEWQPLSTRLGYTLPEALAEAGGEADFKALIDEAAETYEALMELAPEAAPYAVPMACRLRYVLQLNAREAMHLIELRSAPQGHESYRRVAQAMHRAIEGVHPSLAAAMQHVNHEDVALERIAAERRLDARRAARSGLGSGASV